MLECSLIYAGVFVNLHLFFITYKIRKINTLMQKLLLGYSTSYHQTVQTKWILLQYDAPNYSNKVAIDTTKTPKQNGFVDHIMPPNHSNKLGFVNLSYCILNLVASPRGNMYFFFIYQICWMFSSQ